MVFIQADIVIFQFQLFRLTVTLFCIGNLPNILSSNGVIFDSIMETIKTVALSWKGVSASVNGRSILNDSEGFCNPGQMLAIMGPSGAGKTTLLSLISKRQSPSLQIEGEVLANNTPFSSKSFQRFGSFVYQNDLLHQTLTVRQTLQFAAILKIPSRQRGKEKVDQLIKQFELQKCQNSLIGGQLVKGISGGEKKRVCIAIEMVSEPSLLILDEPTSGLDSNKAMKVLSILKKLTKKHYTIIFTIHQPSYLLYAKLDSLILLDKGETVYQGDAQNIVAYIRSLGINVPKTNTISDFFMMEISEYKKEKSNYETPLNHKNYTIRLSQQINKQIQAISTQDLSLNFNNIYMADFMLSFCTLFQRECINFVRNTWKIKVIFMQAITKILLIGVLYNGYMPSREQISTPQGIFLFIKVQSVSFNSVAANLVPALSAVALTLPRQRQIYYKQTDSKKYNPLTYFLTKAIVEFLVHSIGTLIFASVSYWLGGFTNDIEHFLFYTLIVLTMTLVGNSLGFFCATLFKDIDRVSSLTNIVMIPLLILSGMFNKLTSIPDWASWLQYISPFRYGLQLILQNQFGNTTFNGFYDYQSDLGINLSFTNNFIVLLSLGMAFYLSSFFLLKYFTSKISA